MASTTSISSFFRALGGEVFSEGGEVLLEVEVDALVDGESGGGVGGEAVAHGLYLIGVVAEFEQGSVDKAVATVVELHSAVGEHHIVGTEQFVHQVDISHILVVGVVVDGTEVVPIAKVGK